MKTLITPKYYIPLNELESISEVMETIGYMADKFPTLKGSFDGYFPNYDKYQNREEQDLKLRVQTTILFLENLNRTRKSSQDFFETFREVLDGNHRTKMDMGPKEHLEAMNRILSEKYALTEDCLIDSDRHFPIKDVISMGFLIETEGGHQALVDFSKRYTLDDSEIEALEEIIEYTEKELGCRVKNITATPRKSIEEDPYVVFTLEHHDSDEELIVDPKLWDRFKNTLTDASTHYAVYSAMNFSTPDMVEQLVFLFSSKGND